MRPLPPSDLLKRWCEKSARSLRTYLLELSRAVASEALFRYLELCRTSSPEPFPTTRFLEFSSSKARSNTWNIRESERNSIHETESRMILLQRQTLQMKTHRRAVKFYTKLHRNRQPRKPAFRLHSITTKGY